MDNNFLGFLNKCVQVWYEEFRDGEVENTYSRFHLFRFDMLSPRPHWILEIDSDRREFVMEIAKQMSEAKLPDSQDFRYLIRVYDKQDKKDIELIDG